MHANHHMCPMDLIGLRFVSGVEWALVRVLLGLQLLLLLLCYVALHLGLSRLS